MPTILIVEDEPSFLKMYCVLLEREGFKVKGVSTPEDARAALEEGIWSVVILDLKLRGREGGNAGLQLLGDIPALSPSTHAMLISAYASESTITAAFEAGAYDFLEKSTPNFSTLLVTKVRNAHRAFLERQLGSYSQAEREEELRAAWKDYLKELAPNKKGAVLEHLMLMLFQSIPGLKRASLNRSNEVEEIDLVVRNESKDPIWQKESPYFLVECKNWSSTVEGGVFDRFRAKLTRKYQRCRLGFLIAPGGFTSGFRSDQLASREAQVLIVPVDGADLERLVLSNDRNSILKDLHERAVLAANGSLKR